MDWPKHDTLHTCTKHHTLFSKKFNVAFTGFCKNKCLKRYAGYQDNNAFVCNFGQEKNLKFTSIARLTFEKLVAP